MPGDPVHDRHCGSRLSSALSHGRGLNGVGPIPSGQHVFRRSDERIIWVPSAIVKAQPSQIRRLYDDFCVIREGRYGCPPDFNSMTAAWYGNHSDEPNMGCDHNYSLYATRHIRRGEELTLDYSAVSEINHEWSKRERNRG